MVVRMNPSKELGKLQASGRGAEPKVEPVWGNREGMAQRWGGVGAQWQPKGFRSSCSGRGDPSGLAITQPGSLEDPKGWLCPLVRKRSDARLHDFGGRQRGPSV